MKILIFSSREICYFSSNFFANEMGAAFEKLGHEVFVCELAQEDDLDEKLSPFIDQEYDLVLDFNSLLPRMALEDGSLLVNHIKGPFYNWVVDHPLFHHVALAAAIKESNAIALDETQAAYIQTYYPNVKKTLLLPLSASESFVQTKKNEKVQVLFTGTYDTPQNDKKKIDQAPAQLAECMWKLIEMRIEDPQLPMETAYQIYLAEKGIERTKEQFCDDMNRMYASDIYVRNYFRKAVIDHLMDAKIPVKVIGHGWEKYTHQNLERMTIEKPVFFNLSFEKIAKEHILLNVAPIFHHGVHDRVIAGMANHTAVLTERNPYVERHFEDGKELCLYSLKDAKDLANQAEELMLNRQRREAMEEYAYQSYQKQHTWENRAKMIEMQLNT